VQLPLHLDLLPGQPSAQDLHEALAKHYAGSEWVSVEPATPDNKLDALALVDTNKMELRVFANQGMMMAFNTPCCGPTRQPWARAPAVLPCKTSS